MGYDFNMYNSIILTGIVQGLVFGIVVFSSEKYRRASSTLLLGILIVVFSLTNLQYYLGDTAIITTRQLFGIVWFPGQLLSGPLLLFYGLKLLYPEKPIARRTKVLILLPFIIAFMAITYIKITMAGVDKKTYMQAIQPIEGIVEFSSLILDTCIVVWLFLGIRKVDRASKNFKLAQVRPELKWFRNLLVILFSLCFVWLYVAVLMFNGLAAENLWYIMWIALSIIIYWIGHVGIYKYGVQEERRKIRNHTFDRSTIVVMADKQRSDHLTLFENLLIDKKYFLDPELTLDKIADELNLSKSHLSRLINKELQTSFPDYINQLRIKEAQYYLKHPDFSNYTLVAIGLEAGFASKTTFNNTFKKVTGMTPSEYKNDTSIPVEDMVIPS
ncbi:helix-turn-helix transcriptional regulator [Flavobacterium sp.]|uniref:helix-turn-helix domain-containing protein n=1 Tax=Flavobacterium sp. TaxID=239 RepID=UPI00286CA2B6|nr:helix-turn-helix transcriptional regulator [Flavobacterium sp.]